MLKLIEFVLLGVTLLIVLGLVLQGPVEAPPGQEEAAEDEAGRKAS